MYIVQSISEFLNYIENLMSRTGAPFRGTTFKSTCLTFYRGQANAQWGLNPSLYRQGLFKMESLLLQELKHLCPSEFSGNRFDILVKMQHFGLPTRLLDTTTNPLVALYFACAEPKEMDEDGAVYIFPNLFVLWSTSSTIELIMDYVFGDIPPMLTREGMLYVFQEYVNLLELKSKDKFREFLYCYMGARALAVMPARTNSRIEAQDGAFFVCGMKYIEHINKDNPEDVVYTFEPYDIDSIIGYKETASIGEKIIIPKAAKNNILKQLDVLGINERKLFPDLSHQIKYALDFVKNSYPKGLR